MTSLLAHPSFDGFWRQTSGEQDIHTTDLPVQVITGYYDFFHHETVQDFFRLLARKSKAPAQLIIGPWTHGSSNRSKTQDLDFGPDSVMNVQAVNLQWFDRYLKGTSSSPHPLVRYFMMGENKWREAGAWPPANSKSTPLYLRAGKAADFTAPQQEGSTEFTSDPASPVSSIPAGRRDINRGALWSPLDYTEISNHKDVLAWTTEPLFKPVVFAGPIRAELWVEADTPDADWVVRLFAIPPKGLALPVAHGIVRSSFRDSLLKPTPLIPGKRYKLAVDLGSSAASLSAGYRLRVEVAGSSFPQYDRNTNTAEGPFSTKTSRSRQKVHHQRDLASSILLPILPN
jgi:uncharacterized protein